MQRFAAARWPLARAAAGAGCLRSNRGMRECRAAASWALAAERRAEFAVEGRVEILRHPNLGVAGPARLIFAAARDEPHQRLASAGDDDLLAVERLIDKPRQVGLRLV